MYVFDFDGTIVDLWNRYYNVFISCSNSNISFNDYVNAKREFLRDDDVANVLNITLPNDYYEKKKLLLEDKEYLKLDTLIPNRDNLLTFFKENECIILTKRRSSDEFFNELLFLGLGELKEKSFVICPEDNISKKDWLKSHYSNKNITIIGDFWGELEVCELDNANVFFVNTGLLSIAHANSKNYVFKTFESINDIIK